MLQDSKAILDPVLLSELEQVIGWIKDPLWKPYLRLDLSLSTLISIVLIKLLSDSL